MSIPHACAANICSRFACVKEFGTKTEFLELSNQARQGVRAVQFGVSNVHGLFSRAASFAASSVGG